MLIPEASDLHSELRWQSAILSRYGDKLNELVDLLSQFTKALLTSDCGRAELVFDAVNRALGNSLWSIESGVLLGNIKGGIEENRRFLSGIREVAKDAYAQLFGQFASERSDTNLSVNAYNAYVAELLDDIKRNGGDKDTLNYLRLKLDSKCQLRFPDSLLRYALAIESTYSLVDRYLLFVRVAMTLAYTSTLARARELLSHPIAALTTSVRDPRIASLSTYLTGRLPPSTAYSDAFHAAVERYTTGRYFEASLLIGKLIVNRSDNFELYELLAKSHLLLDREVVNPFPQGSIAQKTLTAVTDVLSRNDRTDDSLHYLSQQASLFTWSCFGSQLWAFVLNNSTEVSVARQGSIRALNVHVVTPRFADVFEDNNDRTIFLGGMRDQGVAPITAGLYLSDNDALPESVPTYRRAAYTARHLEANDALDQAVKAYQSILQSFGDRPYIAADAFAGCFRCLVRLGRLRECAAMTLDAYFAHREMLAGVHLKSLLEKYDQENDDDLKRDIAWPLLYHIFYRENDLPRNDKRLFVLLDSFLTANGLTLPSRMLSLTPPPAHAYAVYLLRYVCVPEIIDSLLTFRTSDEVEEERIAICSLLLVIDPANKEEYANEVASIAKARSIRQALRSVDTTRVFVDTDGLRRSLDRVYIERYERYRGLHGLDTRLRESVIEVRSLGGKRVETKATMVVVDEVVELFNELFLDLRERYIFSADYGLDSYLSLRIRHGTLTGQLRSLFERRHLITTKDEPTGKYQRNQYWFDHIPLLNNPNVAAMVDNAFERFATTVDALIEEVRAEWIQIKGDNHAKALFDFDYSARDLGRLYARFGDARDIESFVDGCLDELRDRTERTLQTVRHAIENTLLAGFTSALDELELAVVSSSSELRTSDLVVEIRRARTEVQTDVISIAGWFESVGEVPFPDYDLRHLIDTSIEVWRRAHTQELFSPLVSADVSCTCLGRTFTYLIDALYIVLGNAFTYAPRDDKVVRLEASVSDHRATIVVSNNLPHPADRGSLDALIVTLKERLGQTQRSIGVQREGGSGYYKLGKLRAVDLKDLDLEIEPSFAISESSSTFSVSVAFNCAESRQ
ncbi:MAG: hypothetical protein J0M17_10745 [Planctomycetes bacterium]|nr:hypothetical protein [Planctomycetota bacterium]